MSLLRNMTVSERIEKFIDTYQWLCSASGEKMLSRPNLNFTAVHPFADAMTLVDVSNPDFWHIRLSGTKACERSGCDTTGGNAQMAFSAPERDLRLMLAYSLFENPCGIRAKTRETYNNGAFAILDTIALPIGGANGEKLIAHYAQVVDDIEHAYGKRPLAARTDLVSYHHVDLGHGVPGGALDAELCIA